MGISLSFKRNWEGPIILQKKFSMQPLLKLIFTYHYYDGRDDEVAKLAARELFWNDQDWPELGDHLIQPD